MRAGGAGPIVEGVRREQHVSGGPEFVVSLTDGRELRLPYDRSVQPGRWRRSAVDEALPTDDAAKLIALVMYLYDGHALTFPVVVDDWHASRQHELRALSRAGAERAAAARHERGAIGE